MSKNDPAGNSDSPRHVYGPRPIGALIPSLTRPAFRSRSPGSVQLMTDWAEIAGPALAAITSPRRFASGTLTLACIGPVALELQHLAGPLMERINAHLGRAVVTRLRFVQDMAPPAPARDRRRREPSRRPSRCQICRRDPYGTRFPSWAPRSASPREPKRA